MVIQVYTVPLRVVSFVNCPPPRYRQTPCVVSRLPAVVAFPPVVGVALPHTPMRSPRLLTPLARVMVVSFVPCPRGLTPLAVPTVHSPYFRTDSVPMCLLSLDLIIPVLWDIPIMCLAQSLSLVCRRTRPLRVVLSALSSLICPHFSTSSSIQQLSGLMPISSNVTSLGPQPHVRGSLRLGCPLIPLFLLATPRFLPPFPPSLLLCPLLPYP